MLLLLSAPAQAAGLTDELASAAAAYQRGDFAACSGDCRIRPGGARLEQGVLFLLRGQCGFYGGERERARRCFARAQRLLSGSLRRLARARWADTLWEQGQRRRAVGLYWQQALSGDSLLDGAAGLSRTITFTRDWARDRRGATGKG